MPHKESNDEADHSEVLTATEENRDHRPDRSPDIDQLVTEAFQRLQRADARIWSDTGPAVPHPNVDIADVDSAFTSDLKAGLV